MADRLVIQEDRGYFWIQWQLEDGELGACLGESPSDGTGKPPKDRGNWEHWVANKTLRDLGARRSSRGSSSSECFTFDERKEALDALRAVKQAMKSALPMPDWAVKAAAAGWTPPKGWKP